MNNEKNQDENSELTNSNQSLLRKLKWYEQKYGPYYKTRGIKNWKNLFKKPTTLEWTLFLMIILVLFAAWAYNEDTKQCRDTLENLPNEVCAACREFQTNRDAYEANMSGLNMDFGDITFVNESGVGE